MDYICMSSLKIYVCMYIQHCNATYLQASFIIKNHQVSCLRKIENFDTPLFNRTKYKASTRYQPQ